MKRLLLAVLVAVLTAATGIANASFFPDTVKSATGFAVGSFDGSSTTVISSTGEVTNAVAKTDGVVFVGPNDVETFIGTWTKTRLASGNIALVKTAGADNAFILADITSMLRSTASKGLKLTSIQYAFGIGAADLTAHYATIKKVAFADNAAPTVSNVQAASSIYKVAGTVTSPFIRTITVSSPAFLNPFPTALENDKWLLEINVDAAGSSTYDFFGLWFVFTHDPL